MLGHEIGHFLHQHSIKQWRRTKDIMNALSLLQLVAARTGTQDAYDIFDVSQFVALASLYKYGRDAERESDTEGFARAVKLGYRADQGSALWQGLLAEDNARDRTKPSGIFATHPATEERCWPKSMGSVPKSGSACPDRKARMGPSSTCFSRTSDWSPI